MGKSKSNPSGFEKMIGDLLEMSIIIAGYFLLFNAKVIWRGLKEIKTPAMLLDLIGLPAIAAFFIVRWQWHLKFLYWLSPKIFDHDLLVQIQNLGPYRNFFGVMALGACVWAWSFGIRPFLRSWNYQRKLDFIGLKNARGLSPKIVHVEKLDKHRDSLKIMAAGVGADEIKAKRDQLQSSFGKDIEEIRRLNNPCYVKVVLSTRFLPDYVCFGDHQEELTQNGHFLIGESKKGVAIENIAKLPHMLIAGSTGGGKSQFFKQFLVGLLKSTDHLQMHLIDLKGGLEFKDFSSLPNIKMAKTMESAVSILGKVKKEMQLRFDYLEKKGLNQIDPQRHPFDRIVIGIDEASVLYAQARRDSEDYELVFHARSLTEDIAKLGRAAAIHLVLATQKVSKESIDTRIQENIVGRMCFKTGTPEGSVRVLGNAKASHLPATPGRGIWQFGNNEFEVQAPYLDSNEMKQRLQEVKDEYQYNEKTLKQDFKKEESTASSLPLLSKKLTKENFLNEDT